MKEITEKEFATEVLGSGVPVLVDFYAAWCGPCRSQAPILQQLSDEMGETLKVIKINVDNAEEVARQYGVMSIPTMILFKDGKDSRKLVGLHALNDIKSIL